MAYPFRFGRCVTSTYGSVVVDLIDLPHVQTGFSSTAVGRWTARFGRTRSPSNGSGRI
jgi:hypothetical protein